MAAGGGTCIDHSSRAGRIVRAQSSVTSRDLRILVEQAAEPVASSDAHVVAWGRENLFGCEDGHSVGMLPDTARMWEEWGVPGPDDDRLHAELDRQLAEVRASCDGLATRSGLLVAATAAVAAVFAPRIDLHRHEILLVLTSVALRIATVAAVVTLMPWLKVGPVMTWLTAWMSGGSSATTSRALYDSKTIILGANLNRAAVPVAISLLRGPDGSSWTGVRLR
jgi:hypothetical protein